MSRTVTALFDSRSEAEAAKARLASSRIDADNIRIIDQSSGGSGNQQEQIADRGFMASLKELFMPDEDVHAYGEGIARGGFMVCAKVEDDQADQAVGMLEQSNSIDFDQRQEDWRSEGWTGYTGKTPGYESGGIGTSSFKDNESRSANVEEERIPILEEELKVGKREVARGGARVRSYIVEEPAHEQISLREENVSVERRPVDETLSAGQLGDSDMLQDRTIEMTEMSEEAVVEKEARVREELVVKKTSEQRTENIDETVRHTEVDVDENMRKSEDRSAFGGFGSGGNDQTNQTSRSDFERTDRDKKGF